MATLALSSDHSFHFELLRVLGAARYGGSDIAEVLAAAGQITPGDFESWYRAFVTLADQVQKSVASPTTSRIAVRDAMFRAASYYRAADFFLHGQPDDPRIMSLWEQQTACFDRAIALLPIPGERITVAADGFHVPAIFYRASDDGKPRPTVLICSGFDGSQEELMHQNGFPALDRGYHVLTFEGPGQPSVRRQQGKGFIHDWERVVSPLVDWCATRREIDGARLALVGVSMGGYLAARAAAFEPRLAATICIDGVHDMFSAFTQGMPPEAMVALDDARLAPQFDAALAAMPRPTDTKVRWAMEQAAWSFNTSSPWTLFTTARKMTMAGLGGRVRCPVLVCDAARDHFFEGQPALLAKELGARATHYVFGDELAAADHCHVGAACEASRVVYDWLAGVLAKI